MNEISIVMPSYNEEKNLLELINKVHINLTNKYIFEIVVVDDNSNDETKALITSIKKKYNIKYIKNHINMGQSFSSHLGIKNSIYETIVTMDADGQNDPADIHKLADYYFKNNISLVGGLRLKRKDNLVKILSSRIANYIRNYYLNDNCLDTGCSLKVFDKKIFLEFPYFDGMHRFIPALFSGKQKKTHFISVNHKKRLYGVSKYGMSNRLFKGIRDMVKVKKIIKNMKND
jgi:dolichol-phosphate mannosyltransferase